METLLDLARRLPTSMANMPYDIRGLETNKETVDQTDAQKRADLFRVHVLRRRGLIERDYLTPKIPG